MKLGWNILVTFGCRIALLMLSMVSSILLARILGPEGRGLFALVLLLPELATNLALLGFDQAFVVYAGLTPERRRALVWHSALLATCVGTLVAIGCIVFLVIGAPGFHSLLKGQLGLYIFALTTVPARLLVVYWSGIVRGMNRIAVINFVDVTTKLVSVGLVILLVGTLRFGVAGAVWVDFLVNVGKVILFVSLLIYLGQWGSPSFAGEFWWRTAKFALPAYGASMVSYLNYRVDQFIIGMLLTPQELAFYVLAVDLAETLWIITGAVAGPLLPHLTNTPDRDPALAAHVARHAVIWTGGACLVVFLFADPLISLLYSSAYLPAVAPLRWLLPGIFTLTIGKIVVAELAARERIHYTLWAGLAAVLMNVVGNLLLIPRLGVSGAAVASSISYSLLGLIVTWYYLRETRLSWKALIPCRDDLLPYIAFWRRSVSALYAMSAVTKA